MDLGTVLVIVGLILAVLALILNDYRFRLLAAAIILIGVGVLIGVDGLSETEEALAALAR